MAPPPPAGSETPLTPIVFHVLLALSDGAQHGYAIMKAVEETAGPSVQTGPGTIYGSLQRMETAGLVRELPRPGGDRRRSFEITPAGRRALAAESRRLVELAQLVRERRLIGQRT